MDPETGDISSKQINNDQQTGQEENSVSSSSSSSSSSSTSSDSSDGHNVFRQIPHSMNFMSAPEPRGRIPSRRKKSSNLYSFVNSNPGSSPSSSQQNQLIGVPGYDPNRIPVSIFAAKPANPMEWSVASNESLFSIHTGNASFSREHGLAIMFKSGEIPKIDEPVSQKTNTNLVPPSVKESRSTKRKPKTAETLNQNGKSDSESDDEEEETEAKEEEEEKDVVRPNNDNIPKILAQTEKQEQEEADNVKEIKPEETEGVCHSMRMSCHSDTSNNSNGSFAFPVLENDGEGIKTPSMGTEKDDSEKQPSRTQPEDKEPSHPPQPQPPLEPETQTPPYPQLQMHTQPQPYPQRHTQPQPYPQLETHMQPQLQPQPQPQQEEKPAEPEQEAQAQSPKASGNGWFSCFFHCPLRCC